ncbi:MAG: hypothetical protein AAF236_14610 [Verrucomicrobiota bacterium]
MSRRIGEGADLEDLKSYLQRCQGWSRRRAEHVTSLTKPVTLPFMTINRRIVLDENGDPSEVLIPYDQFQELSERYGWDLDDVEEGELREAIADSKAGNREAFVPASDV